MSLLIVCFKKPVAKYSEHFKISANKFLKNFFLNIQKLFQSILNVKYNL